MNRKEYETAADIFARAVALPAERRSVFVAEACAGNDWLKQTVNRLLDADAGESFLDDVYREPTDDGFTDFDPDRVTSIGAYAVRRVVARGSMGVVFLAQQANPSRDVAVKLFDPGLRAGDSIGQEAAALGRLQHSGIARVYEAGHAAVAVDGEAMFDGAFMAMEFITGNTLDRVGPLDRRAVLRLLIRVAEAVEHAHRRGVIHRDLKPTNIVVSEDGHPHVIDFGVGVLRGDVETSASAPSIGGTLPYMAPEQLMGVPAGIDTRVDVYAIGAIAYELVTGRRLNAAAEGVHDATLQRLVQGSGGDQAALVRVAGIDLAAVVGCATAADPDARYPSAGALAEDLSRVLGGLPSVHAARSPLRMLLLSARKHRRVSAVLGIAGATVLAALVGMSLATIRATDAVAVADAALDEARTEALHAEKLAAFLKSSFLGADPEERGAGITLLDAIDYAAGRIGPKLGDTPAAEADVRSAIAFVYRRQGSLRAALEQVTAAHEIQRSLYGADDPQTLASREEIGYLTWLYAGDARSARDQLTAVLDTHIENGASESPDAAWVRMKLAHTLVSTGELEDAEALLSEAEPLMIRHYGAPFAARTARQRAIVALHQGRADIALELAQQAIALCKGVGEQDYIFARTHFTLAQVHRHRGEVAQADAALDVASQLFASMLSGSSTEVLSVVEEQARLGLLRGDSERALYLARQARDGWRQTLGSTHPRITISDALVQLCLASRANGDEQRRLLAGAEAMVRDALAPGDPDAVFVANVAGGLLR